MDSKKNNFYHYLGDVMYIIGNIPDVFDHMPHALGGVDYAAIFDKRKYDNLSDMTFGTLDQENFSAKIAFDTKYIGYRNNEYFVNNTKHTIWRRWDVAARPEIDYRLCDLFYCGKVYVIAEQMRHTGGNHYVSEGQYFYVSHEENADPFCIEPSEKILDYAKANNLAFFIYNSQKHHDSVSISPVMSYIPTHKISHPIFDDVEKLYIEIYNQLLSYKNDPGTIEVENKHKIQQAGFDLKSSFRHR